MDGVNTAMNYEEVLEQLISPIRKRDGEDSLELFKEQSRPLLQKAIDRELLVQLVSRERIRRRLALFILFP